MSSSPRPTSLSKAEAESVTNPHPSDYLEARIAALNDGGSCHPSQGGHVAFQDLPLDAIPRQARAVLSAPQVFLHNSQSEDALAPLQLPRGSGEVLCLVQSSKTASFSLAWQDVSCNLYYDPGSDNLVLKNNGSVSMLAAPILTDNELDLARQQLVLPRGACVISPGPWRLSSSSERTAEASADILLFRRRYVAEKSATPSAKAGTKRSNESPVIDAPKRARYHGQEHDRSVVLFAIPSKDRDESAIVAAGHPLLDLQPGEDMTIRSLIENAPKTEAGEQALSDARPSPDTYSLKHLRHIAADRPDASVFRANHTVFGDTAVKVIRSLKDPATTSIPRIAEVWRNEERLMRRMNHPSIIRMFETDARLYSICMEYLPYQDLAAWRNRDSKSFSSGTPADALRVLTDMASALKYLQEKDIVHNDIKPANILYEQARGAILIDFGLACSYSSDALCLGGTPWYLGPELIDLRVRGFESDIFALGITALYLLGKIPLPDATRRMWVIVKLFTDKQQEALMRTWLAEVEGRVKRLE